MRFSISFIIISLAFISSCSLSDSLFTDTIEIQTPDLNAKILKPDFRIKNEEINESSGLTAGKKSSHILFTHNDSGDKARLFALIPEKSKNFKFNFKEIKIGNSKNIDWEDICTDNKGNLIIADTGNNKNKRDNLCLYIVAEPDLTKTKSISAEKKIRFRYPEQTWWNRKKNFDCEAVFYAKGKIYLLTKHRNDNFTALYRFDSLKKNIKNPVKLIAFFNSKDRVTGADCSSDGEKLIVLTRSSVWLFIAEKPEDFFKGETYWLPIIAGQCEGICFYKNKILISNEEGNIYSLTQKDLIKLHR